MRRMPQQYPNPHVRRERDPRAFKRQMFLLASCLVVAAGFVCAVRQQILAVDYGYKTEALRREREALLDEQRRLLLALEESASPAQLEHAARELGMQPLRAAQIQTGGAVEPRPEGTSFVGSAASAAGVVRH
jgi:cell division protein FtsL